ncbi:MAG TPA: FCD domain-containing protein [Daejeonella sp.]|uniref:FadR/GntR family transcriptional regulator n=1 Tax=Daejeonella sp. TaxID=2805397 RepID=UPI002ED977DA
MKQLNLTTLTPIKYLTQVDKVEMSLEAYFRSENFQIGDPIPKEMELAEAMGVSRTAIREALSRFRLLGIIESRKNRGMIITRPDILNNMHRVMDPQLLDGATMKEIFEMRLVIEIGLADILFLRKTNANLKKLEQIVEKEEKTDKKPELVKYDIEFHSMLYEISENKTIQRFQKLLMPVFDYMNNELHVKSQLPDTEYVSHRVLLNVLKNGTPEEFRSKMKRHLLNYFEKV